LRIITIIISTLNQGILNTEKTVKIQHPDISYLIIHQNHKNVVIPEFLRREDIEIISSRAKGLSKSRNMGLRNCKTEYALIADDDIEYIYENLLKVLEIIKEERPDFATFKIKTTESEPEFKEYLKNKHYFKFGYIPVASIEILVNVNKVKQSGVAFDERFGLGAIFMKGEEEIFIMDLMKSKLCGVYYPLDLVRHPYESTGTTKLKEYQNYFHKGAFSARTKKRISIPKTNNRFRVCKNHFFFILGKIYASLITPTKYEQ
jgi:glycosyltransferase involved in cell wall biosynthesis